MRSFLWAQLRGSRWRAIAIGVAIALASASFVLLTAASRTTDIRVQGTLQSTYRATYDILVRPKGAQSPIERSRGLISNNALGGLFGGITLDQYDRIARIPGVDVAAPIANVGYVIPYSIPHIDLKDIVGSAAVQLYRISFENIGDGGTSRYPGSTSYIYINRRDRIVAGPTGYTEISRGGSRTALPICDTPTAHGSGPFARTSFVECYPGSSGAVSTGAQVWFPILLAAIDPSEESRLVNLDRTVVSGRYLTAQDRPRFQLLPGPTRSYHLVVPIIASTRTYVDDYTVAHIQRLAVPGSLSIGRALGSDDATSFLSHLQGPEVARRVISAQASYDQALAGVFGATAAENISWSYWTSSDVRYSAAGIAVSPLPVENPISIWRDSASLGGGSYQQAPAASADVQFRRLYPRIGSPNWDPTGPDGGLVLDTPVMDVVGRYDPSKLPGFSPLSRVPMETYYPPELLPADAGSRDALHGQALLPTANLGGYVSQPPLFLTTLRGMQAFLNPRYYAGAGGAAPISVIRVRVTGATGPDPLSQARVRAVATAIHDETGLQVDITAGSSPERVSVLLPAGRFGRPQLLLYEEWSKKGASVTFLRALDRKRLGLISLILLTSVIFVAGSGYSSVRWRRTEIGVLACIGWSRRAVFLATMSELAVVGVLAGLLGFAIAAALEPLLSLAGSLPRAALVVPVALIVAIAAGIVPAWSASRTMPLDAIGVVTTEARRRRPSRGLISMALANVLRVPWRLAAAGSGLLIASAAMTLLLAIDQAFRGTLVGTLLGNAVSLQVRGLDFVTVVLVAVLGSLSLLDAVYLNIRERARESSTLQALGWSNAHLVWLFSMEALVMASVATTIGGLVALAIGKALGLPFMSLVKTASISVGAGVAIAALVSAAASGAMHRMGTRSTRQEE